MKEFSRPGGVFRIDRIQGWVRLCGGLAAALLLALLPASGQDVNVPVGFYPITGSRSVTGITANGAFATGVTSNNAQVYRWSYADYVQSLTNPQISPIQVLGLAISNTGQLRSPAISQSADLYGPYVGAVTTMYALPNPLFVNDLPSTAARNIQVQMTIQGLNLDGSVAVGQTLSNTTAGLPDRALIDIPTSSVVVQPATGTQIGTFNATSSAGNVSVGSVSNTSQTQTSLLLLNASRSTPLINNGIDSQGGAVSGDSFGSLISGSIIPSATNPRQLGYLSGFGQIITFNPPLATQTSLTVKDMSVDFSTPIVVGQAVGGQAGGFIYAQLTGVVDAQTFFVQRNLALPTGFRVTSVNSVGVTASKIIFGGDGVNAQGQAQGYVAVVFNDLSLSSDEILGNYWRSYSAFNSGDQLNGYLYWGWYSFYNTLGTTGNRPLAVKQLAQNLSFYFFLLWSQAGDNVRAYQEYFKFQAIATSGVFPGL